MRKDNMFVLSQKFAMFKSRFLMDFNPIKWYWVRYYTGGLSFGEVFKYPYQYV